MTDAETIRAAVVVLRRRSTRPNSLVLDIICKALNGAADKYEFKDGS